MKTFIATISIIALTAVSTFAQGMPDDLKMKLEAKAAQEFKNDASLAKAWISKQKGAWESIQSLSFPIDASDIKLIKDMAEKKYPLDYISQEAYITKQADAASTLPEYRLQIGEEQYNAIKAEFGKNNDGNISDLLEVLQKAAAAKIELDSITTDKFRKKTFELIKRAVTVEYPTNFDEQIVTLKEIIEGKKPDIVETEVADNNTSSVMELTKLTESEQKKIAIEMFNAQTYSSNSENRVSITLTEIRGKRVMLVPFEGFSPGTTFSNRLGDQLEYDENEIYSSKEAPFLIIFPKNVPDNYVPAKFPLPDSFRNLLGSSQFVVGQYKQNIDAYPVKIRSITDKTLMLNRKTPNTFTVGSHLFDPINKDTLAIFIKYSPSPVRVNWLEKSEVNRFTRMLERAMTSEGLVPIRVDNLVKWEKYTPERYYEQKMALEKFQQLTNEFTTYFTSKSISESENSAFIGSAVKNCISEFKSRMNEPMRERKYKEFLNSLMIVIKSEVKRLEKIEFYNGFSSSLNLYSNIVQQHLKTLEMLSKGQNYKMIIQDDLMRNQQ